MNEPTPGQTVILSDMEVTGSITFKGTLLFEGKLQNGSISGETLVVGKSANIKGNVRADSIRLDGTVSGNITVAGKCDLGESAVLTGDIKSSSIAMADGATFVGQMQIGQQAERPKAKR